MARKYAQKCKSAPKRAICAAEKRRCCNGKPQKARIPAKAPIRQARSERKRKSFRRNRSGFAGRALPRSAASPFQAKFQGKREVFLHAPAKLWRKNAACALLGKFSGQPKQLRQIGMTRKGASPAESPRPATFASRAKTPAPFLGSGFRRNSSCPRICA